MSRQQVERPQRGHLLQPARPVDGVTLDLVRVAGVGRAPDERVAGAEHAVRRAPDPRLVVSLAPAVVQLEDRPADRGRDALIVGGVGVGEAGVSEGPGFRRKVELDAIDVVVLSREQPVAVEAARKVAVGDDVGAGGHRAFCASAMIASAPVTWSTWPCV